jgi:DNA (cytosine-5)-methyltransferase 1
MPKKVREQLALFSTAASDTGEIASPFQSLTTSIGVDLQRGWIDRFGRAIHASLRETLRQPIRVLSLFSGAGGLDIGFHDAGFDVKVMVEIEERFAATLTSNSGQGKYFGDVDVQNIDIRKFRPPAHFHIDFIIGGPPCQPFSAAGRRVAGVRGTTSDDGQLFEEYVRLLTQLQPRGFLFENVYGITGAEDGKAWEKIRTAFEDAGYKIAFRILDAADYGVPQHRERMFIVGSRDMTFKFPCPTHGPDSPDNRPHLTAGEVLESVGEGDSEAKAAVGGRYGHLLQEVPPGLNYSFFTERMGHPNPVFAWRSKFSDFLYKADPSVPVRTLKAQIGQYSGPFHWESRPFTVAEFKRLQTFPDDYQLSGGRQAAIHQIGNSVPPQLARILALAILDQFFDVELPVRLPLLESGVQLSFRKRKQKLTTSYRAKAKSAITRNGHAKFNIEAEARTHYANLTSEFILDEVDKKVAELQIEFIPSPESWLFEANHIRQVQNDTQGFSIYVSPAITVPWGLPTQCVTLRGKSLDPQIFTALWKMFESELIKQRLKADLVQLCGYYQYKPAIKCKMKFDVGATLGQQWLVARCCVEGQGVSRIIDQAELAQLWQVPTTSVLKHAKWLRQLGYEVRNSNTNPQLPIGHFLIPYAFPTLTSMSVQLRKSLAN